MYLETPANAIDLSPGQDFLAAVGKNFFKIYSVKEEGDFEDIISLRPNPKSRNQNFSANDVKFCPLDER